MTAAATPASPLRFLGAVLGGWVVLRAGILLLWPEAAAVTAATSARDEAVVASPPAPPQAAPVLPVAATSRPTPESPGLQFAARNMGAGPQRPPVDAGDIVFAERLPPILVPPNPTGRATMVYAPPVAPGMVPRRRWSVSAWLLLRDDVGGGSLAPGGTLGGSQAGARLVWRLDHRLALSARAYAPLRRTAGAEAALGLEWRPMARFPVALLAERRIGIGREGRDAFALMLHGGGSARLPLSARLDGYVQAGVVGLAARDLFVDGAARLSVPVGPVEVGGGAWGAAQPGAARLDAGPSVSWRLPVPRANLRLSADWRFRIAGDARPESGPALTVAADF